MPTIASSAVRRRLAAGLTSVALLASACTGGDDDTTPSTTMSPTTTTVPERIGDGVLTVGAFLPLTGPGAAFGPPMIEALNEAVATINAAGGVLGEPVVLEQVDEGAGTIDDLLGLDVDAIIGPASSTLAMTALPAAVDPVTGVVTCSPMATSAALDGYPDEDLFFRTAPSDSLQMLTIAREAEGTGAPSVAVGYLDDPYGRGLEAAFVEAMDGRVDVSSIGFSGDQDDLSDVASTILDGDPAVVVVLGDADDGSRLLNALDTEADDPPQVLINDSLRQARAVIQGLSAEFRDGLTGYAPQSGSAVEGGPPGFFVAHAVDCLNLIALAAISAESDNPMSFRAQMSSVSSGGRVCTTFESCVATLEEGFGIDYNGFSGYVNLSGVTGDPVRAWFQTFTFDEDGNEIPGSPIDTRD